jgi:sugar diacid utilization regulator
MQVIERPDERMVRAQLAELTLPSGNVPALVERLASLAGCGLTIVDEPDPAADEHIELTAGTEQVGFLAVDAGGAASPESIELLRIGAPVLAVEVVKARAAMEHGWALQGSLLEALIEAGPVLTDTLTRRAERLAVDLTRPWRIAVIETTEDDRLPDGLAEAAGRPSSPAERSLSCTRGNQLLVAVPDDDGEGMRGKLRHLTRLARGRGTAIRVGISSPGVDLGRALLQAESALELARRAEEPVQMFHDEMGALRFLLDAPRTEEMADLVREEIGPLAERDSSRNGQLLPTLKVFLGECGNRSRTAEICHVHLSTVKYRLGLIESILDRDLGCAHVRFRLMLALEVREVLRTLRADPLPA